MTNRKHRLTAVAALTALVTIGCGRSGLERVEVSGKVTYRGEVLESGEPPLETGGKPKKTPAEGQRIRQSNESS